MSHPTRTGRPPVSDESNVDRYIKESCRSFKECNVKNNARRNSLQKRTLGIEVERRMANAELSREERMLRDQLRQMNLEKMKHNLIHNVRAKKTKHDGKKKTGTDEKSIPIEPYPVTLRNRSPTSLEPDKHLEREGSMFANRRLMRRSSMELEDLRLDTRSGNFSPVREDSDLEDSPRRRVYSMSVAQNPRFRKRMGFSSSPSSSTPGNSPALRKKVLGSKDSPGSGSSGSQSRENIDHFSSLDELHWAGDPEAIHSVRRPRRTVEEQELESEIHRTRSKKHSVH